MTEWTHRFNQWEGFGAGGFSPTPPLSVGLSIAITQASVSGVARSAIYCIRDSRYQLLVAQVQVFLPFPSKNGACYFRRTPLQLDVIFFVLLYPGGTGLRSVLFPLINCFRQLWICCFIVLGLAPLRFFYFFFFYGFPRCGVLCGNIYVRSWRCWWCIFLLPFQVWYDEVQ